MAAVAACMTDYMEAVARKQRCEPPTGYGYKADVALGVGCFLDEQTGCKVLEKPVPIPSGKLNHQGYIMLYAYCRQEGTARSMISTTPTLVTLISRQSQP